MEERGCEDRGYEIKDCERMLNENQGSRGQVRARGLLLLVSRYANITVLDGTVKRAKTMSVMSGRDRVMMVKQMGQ